MPMLISFVKVVGLLMLLEVLSWLQIGIHRLVQSILMIMITIMIWILMVILKLLVLVFLMDILVVTILMVKILGLLFRKITQITKQGLDESMVVILVNFNRTFCLHI